MIARRLILSLLLAGAGTLLVAGPTHAAGAHARASADEGDDSDAPATQPEAHEPGVRDPGVREPGATRSPAEPQVKVVLPRDKSAPAPKEDAEDDPDLRQDSVSSDAEDPEGDAVTAAPEAQDDETVDAQDDATDDADDDEATDGD